MIPRLFIKRTVVLIAAVMWLFTAVTVSAQTVKLNEDIQTNGKEISYTVSVSKDSGMCGLSFEVKYDATQLKLEESSYGKILGTGTPMINAKKEGKVLLSYISTAELTEGGELLVLEFSALSEDTGKLNIALEIDEFIDSKTDAIPFEWVKSEHINTSYLKPQQSTASSSVEGSRSEGGEENSEESKPSVNSESTENNSSEADSHTAVSDGYASDAESSSSTDQSGVSTNTSSDTATGERDVTDVETHGPNALPFIIAAVIIAVIAVLLLILYKAKIFHRRNLK